MPQPTVHDVINHASNRKLNPRETVALVVQRCPSATTEEVTDALLARQRAYLAWQLEIMILAAFSVPGSTTSDKRRTSKNTWGREGCVTER